VKKIDNLKSIIKEAIKIEEALSSDAGKQYGGGGGGSKSSSGWGSKDSEASDNAPTGGPEPKGPISGPYPAGNIKLVEKYMDEAGMTNGYTRVALLSVLPKESSLVPKSEKTYHNTSVSRIKTIWPWLGKKYSDDEIEKLKVSTSPSDGNNKAGLGLFDIVYGPERPGATYGNKLKDDGSRFRGRGFNQITWRGTYERMGFASNPDALNQPDGAAKAGVSFLARRLKQKFGTVNPPFKSQAEANKALANANAGWGKKLGGRGNDSLARAIANTNAASKKFKTV